MVIDGGGGQDTSFHAADLLSLQVEGDALGVVDIYIGQRDVDTSVLSLEAEALTIGTLGLRALWPCRRSSPSAGKWRPGARYTSGKHNKSA